MDKAPESNAWKRRKKMAQERRSTQEIFEELKAIRTEFELHGHLVMMERLQELIWKLGEELGEF